MRKTKQLSLLKNENSAYGGDLRNTRKGRSRPRPLSTRETMHLVLRSTQAKGDWSFKRAKNEKNLNRIVQKFAFVYGVRLISMANVGNHLHLRVKLTNRFAYNAFIRAITGAIAMSITGRNRWNRVSTANTEYARLNMGATNEVSARKRARSAAENRHAMAKKTVRNLNQKFWDYRPFTRVVQSLPAFLNLKDYIRINALEGFGYCRDDARFMLSIEKRWANSE